MGVSGTGKSEIGSRLAARLGVEFVEGDADHSPANIAKMAAGIPLNDEDRHGWLLLLQARIGKAADEGRGLVLSCSALKRRYRDILRGGDPNLAFVHLAGDRELIAARMLARRGHFMPMTLLDSQFRDLESLQDDERGIRVDIRLPSEAIIEQLMQSFQND
ncbi:gluconokinase [Noviherbaspirillum cavernae]|uniref:Gluconokinase n=2 Tax=Noviherbaspirillum cavernae TaxID=2320862 RepID=A0A418WWE1_9BURK|nr:gluconokinase [Noviherbaspirillum cavernae]